MPEENANLSSEFETTAGAEVTKREDKTTQDDEANRQAELEIAEHKKVIAEGERQLAEAKAKVEAEAKAKKEAEELAEIEAEEKAKRIAEAAKQSAANIGQTLPDAANPDTTEGLTQDEIALLLYCEDRAVNKDGRLNTANLNQPDFAKLREWDESGFVKNGRIVSADVTPEGSHWCNLSDEAWTKAGILRRVRGRRVWAKRRYETTADRRG